MRFLLLIYADVAYTVSSLGPSPRFKECCGKYSSPSFPGVPVQLTMLTHNSVVFLQDRDLLIWNLAPLHFLIFVVIER